MTGGIDWSDRKFLDESSYNPVESNGHSPRLVLSPWSECSTTCGPGVQTRSAECMAAHPMAGMIRLPYSECQSQPQPSLFEPCETRPCPLQEDPKTNHEEAPYKWENGDWGPCSASCLGGKQKAALLCRETATGRTVPWSQCDARTRPPQSVRQCNQHACPPVWQVGAFGPCSVTCGGGTATRTVSCIRPVSRSGGADAHIVLRDVECNLPKPSETETCGAVECPASWIIGEWTECSASCGSGEQRRAVVCEGRDARGRTERRPEKECTGEKPPSAQMCSLGSCGKPQLLSNRVFEQNASEKKLTLGIGGVATLYQGTSIKIKCPRKNFDKKKIYWTKNGKRIRNDGESALEE
ncbi:thrombospondin type 1 domain protein [Oesophagostomum dentatum]|uniref:Thrombospondin type 1 domain protein n=1 Tax=Oesophagostomum dentatum TaxID=61180 RepID=A0A0B1TAX8_OESDE|nr:thrombospondin type 1 domain protein [Oesophagostomum dentatum]